MGPPPVMLILGSATLFGVIGLFSIVVGIASNNRGVLGFGISFVGLCLMLAGQSISQGPSQ